MISYINKDLTTVTEGIIAHGCNNYGRMGAGVALALKNKWPKIYPKYHALCNETIGSNEALLGTVNLVKIDDKLYVANCFTQNGYGRNGRFAIPEAIKHSLKDTFEHAWSLNLPLYLPKIGAGLGGLDWAIDVEPIIKDLATTYPNVNTYICTWP